MKIIGLLGKAGSGKTSVAKHLQEHGFRRISIADPIKQLAIAYFDITEEEAYESKPPHVRAILQGLGSFIREQIDENYFIQEALNKIKYSDGDKFVIDDLRLAEEAAFIKDAGGIVIKVECPDKRLALEDSQAEHITEQIDAIPYDHLLSAEYGNIAKLYEGIKERSWGAAGDELYELYEVEKSGGFLLFLDS